MRAKARPLPLEPPARPTVVAHRGASAVAPEHTLSAYVEAIECGAEGLECDVRLTRDGHLVCVHDRTVNRTSDGVGVVSALDLETLQGLDFASWHDSSYTEGVEPDRAEGGAVLTLERLLELVRDATRPIRLLIETKHPTRYGGLVEKELVTLLARFGWAGRPGPRPRTRHRPDLDSPVVVMSFAATALRRVRLLAPDVPTVLLFDRRLPGVRSGVFPPGVSVAGPGLQILKADPGFVARAHARGYPVYVWTANSAADVEFLRSVGVDTIITDRPRDVLAQL